MGLALTALEIARRNDLLGGVDSIFGHQSREALDGILAGSSRAQQLLRILSPAKQHATREAASTAFVSGFREAMLVAFLLLITAAVLSALLLRAASRRPEPLPSSSAVAHE